MNQARQLRVGGNCLPEQVIDQHGVGQLQKAGQGLALLGGRRGELAPGEALEEDIQLFHTAAATPQEAACLLVEARVEGRLGVDGHWVFS